MIVNSQNIDPITRAARDSGLRRSHNGTWKLGKDGPAYEIRRTAAGFVQLERPIATSANDEPLNMHSQKSGPVKFVTKGESTCARFEFRMGRKLNAGWLSVENEARSQMDRLYGRMLEYGLAATDLDPGNCDKWSPPPTKFLVGRLSQAGYTVAVDERQDLRLTLKRKHSDGQVRIQRGDGQLRLSMELGKWSELHDISIRSMLDLAGQFNQRTHLVRIAWHPPPASASRANQARDADTHQRERLTSRPGEFRCEAQVDLSGLPYDGSPNRVLDQFWSVMLVDSMAGLELALRQLSLELGVLADPKHGEIVELLM